MARQLTIMAIGTLALGCALGCIPAEEYKIRAKQAVQETPPDQVVVLDAKMANQIVLDYRDGRRHLHKKKVIEVAGVVRSVVSETQSDADSTTYRNQVELTIPEYAALTITCIFDKDQAAYVQSLVHEDEIRLKGQVRDVEATSLTLIGCMPLKEGDLPL